MNQGYKAYRTATIDTADQGKLILIAYDFAIKHCKLALENFGDYQTIEARTKHIFKVQDALTELLSGLRLDVGEIAQRLYQLYNYMLRATTQACVKGDKSKMEEVLRYLVDLRGAWEVAIRNVRSEAAAAVTCDATTSEWKT